MFTGIIQDIGSITAIDKQGDWIVTVETRLPLTDKAIGASVAHSGVCLTVVEIGRGGAVGTSPPLAGGIQGGLVNTSTPVNQPPPSPPASGVGALRVPSRYKVQLSEETLSKTTALRWQVGSRINLEPALRVGDELGGHYVSGHVDGIARVVGRSEAGDSVRFEFDVPPDFAKFIAPKGSVTIDGVSLTVNAVDGARFSVNIIPHTQKATTLGALQVGDESNFEIDMLARYVQSICKT